MMSRREREAKSHLSPYLIFHIHRATANLVSIWCFKSLYDSYHWNRANFFWSYLILSEDFFNHQPPNFSKSVWMISDCLVTAGWWLVHWICYYYVLIKSEFFPLWLETYIYIISFFWKTFDDQISCQGSDKIILRMFFTSLSSRSLFDL